jgi:hypothetical protein
MSESYECFEEYGLHASGATAGSSSLGVKSCTLARHSSHQTSMLKPVSIGRAFSFRFTGSGLLQRIQDDMASELPSSMCLYCPFPHGNSFNMVENKY